MQITNENHDTYPVRRALVHFVVSYLVLNAIRVFASAAETQGHLSARQEDLVYTIGLFGLLLFVSISVFRVPDWNLRRNSSLLIVIVTVSHLISLSGTSDRVALLFRSFLDATVVVCVSVVIFRLTYLYVDGERKREQRLLESLAYVTSNRVGTDFLTGFVDGIVKTLNVSLCFVSECTDGQRTEQILSSAALPPRVIPFSLEPKRPVTCEEGELARSFPEMGVLLIPLLDTSEKTIGHVCLLHDRQLVISKGQRLAVSIFASRAAAELERKQTDQKRKALEAKMLQVQKLESLGLLAGGIAHDFNNLLSAIRGFATLARNSMQDADAADFCRIESIVDKGGMLCNRLLAYAGQAERKDGVCELHTIVRETVEIVGTGRADMPEFIIRVPDEPVRVWGDNAQLHQIVLNLLTNSADAIQNGKGRVETTIELASEEDAAKQKLELPTPGNYALLTVADNGEGMDDDAINKIFDPFYSTKGEGHGLGLAAVAGIVRGHGGDIVVESQLGIGTRVIVALPITLEPDTNVEAFPDQEYVFNNETVLVVDDDDMVRVATTLLLESAKLNVLAVSSGEEAIEVFKKRGDVFFAILLDQTMPSMSGPETFSKLRALGANAPIIIMSGYSKSKLEDTTNCWFLEKPFSRERLLRVVAESTETNNLSQA